MREIEEVEDIHHQLRADVGTQRKKADKYLPTKSLTERKKNPTDLADSLSPSVGRKRRSELFEAACQINGGSNEKNGQRPPPTTHVSPYFDNPLLSNGFITGKLVKGEIWNFFSAIILTLRHATVISVRHDCR